MFEKLFKKNDKKSESQEPVETCIPEVVSAVPTDILTVDASAEPVTTEVNAPDQTVYESPSSQPPPLTYKEAKALKRARYEEIMDNPMFKNSYVLMNSKTGQIVDIKAASSFHACNIIGWKYKQVKVLAVNSLEKAEESSTINK